MSTIGRLCRCSFNAYIVLRARMKTSIYAESYLFFTIHRGLRFATTNLTFCII